MALKSYFEQYPHVTLMRLSDVTNIPYYTLYRYAHKKPPEADHTHQKHNYAAMEQLFQKLRIDWTKLDWEALNTPAIRRGVPLQTDLDKWEVGDKVYLRFHDDTPYTILYKTPTHIVVMLDGTTEPIAWSNNTFLSHGPSCTTRSMILPF